MDLQLSRVLDERPFIKPKSGQVELWRLDRVDATVNGEPAGYIKISYVPKERFEPLAKDIYVFLSQRGLIFGGNALALSEWTDTELQKMAYRVLERRQGWNLANEVNWKEMKRADLLGMLENARPEVERLYGKQWREFESFHVDRPLVDYVKVEEQLQRRGIGTQLYFEAAKWMSERGMQLHASGVQTEAAKAIWDKLAERGSVEQIEIEDLPKPRRRLRMG